ncbi:MAG: hypothetical protein Altm2KO_16140 [Alteromonas macleodii]|jgi:glycosyltransferase involved in cell wall biosynthesis
MCAALTVSVIIPVWNDSRRILKCIDALKKQTIPADQFEVIVVDNGSFDNTFEVISGIEGITAVQETRTGSYAARNKGLSIANGEFVAFTDSDCVPEPSWLEKLIESARCNPGFGVIAGDMSFFIDEEQKAERYALDYESFFSMKQEQYAKEGACITANWLSAKQVLEQHGCFDANLKSGGDHEMSKRLSRNGFPVVFCKEAIVNHPARSFDEILKKRRRVIGGAWDKNSSKLKPFSMYWRASKLFIRRILTTLFGTKATIQKKFSVMKVVIAIFVVSLAEITRLMVGNTSSRS